MVNEDDAVFIKSCLKAHGYKFSDNGSSESDAGKSESDDELRSMKPPPIPFDDFKDRIVKLNELNENSNQLNSTIFYDEANTEVIDKCIVPKQNNNRSNQSNDNLINIQAPINQSVKVELAISKRRASRVEVSRFNVESDNDRAPANSVTKINLEIPKKKRKKKKIRQSNPTLSSNGAPTNVLAIPNPEILKQNAFKKAQQFKLVDNQADSVSNLLILNRLLK